MAQELREAIIGMRRVCEDVSGDAQVLLWPMEPMGNTALRIRFAGDDPEFALGGSSFVGTIDVEVFVNSQDQEELILECLDYMSPTGPRSVQAAVDGNRTLYGTVDDCTQRGRVPPLSEVTTQGGGVYIMGVLRFAIYKQVTS